MNHFDRRVMADRVVGKIKPFSLHNFWSMVSERCSESQANGFKFSVYNNYVFSRSSRPRTQIPASLRAQTREYLNCIYLPVQWNLPTADTNGSGQNVYSLGVAIRRGYPLRDKSEEFVH